MQHAITAQPRPMRAFHVSLRCAGRRLSYTALARSSGDALSAALAIPNLTPPLGASVRPVGSPAEARRIAALKCALADLVE